MWTSHPIHPSTVHFPIAFLGGANVINLIYGVAIYVPAFSPFKVSNSNIGMLAIFGYFLNVIGLVTSVPALLSGFAELYAMIQGRGLFVMDKNTGEQKLEPVVKTTLIHVSSRIALRKCLPLHKGNEAATLIAAKSRQV